MPPFSVFSDEHLSSYFRSFQVCLTFLLSFLPPSPPDPSLSSSHSGFSSSVPSFFLTVDISHIFAPGNYVQYKNGCLGAEVVMVRGREMMWLSHDGLVLSGGHFFSRPPGHCQLCNNCFSSIPRFKYFQHCFFWGGGAWSYFQRILLFVFLWIFLNCESKNCKWYS